MERFAFFGNIPSGVQGKKEGKSGSEHPKEWFKVGQAPLKEPVDPEQPGGHPELQEAHSPQGKGTPELYKEFFLAQGMELSHFNLRRG